MIVRSDDYNEQWGRAAETAGPVTDTDWTGADMRTMPHESLAARLEAQRDAALAAFAHLVPRIMLAAERDDLEAASLLLALKRGMDLLEAEGLTFEDAKQARIRIFTGPIDGVAA